MPDPYSSDLIVHSSQPFNAEPPLHRLRASFITRQSDFYVRSHGDIPRLDAAIHRLRVKGCVARPLDLSMRDLRERFPRRSVTAVLQCAGNRRADMHAVRPVSGDPLAAGAIGNARWHGVALADVLREAGARDDPALHVAFICRDEVDMPGEGRFRFGASIPMGKALSPEVLLAFAMNGEPLAPEHGFPLRVIVPGYAGVRSPKWLDAITVQDMPSDNHMQQRDYKLLPPGVTADTVDWAAGIPINDMPLNAATCEPAAGATVPAGRVIVKGYAIATGRTVARVDVSADSGRTWRQAELESDPAAPWSWTFWRTTLDLAAGEHELTVRAWDSAGQTQPARPDDVWNFKGYLCAAWHRVRVRVLSIS
nr:molybdopterin-dependent oxidoreductase [uncultured Rhodopila sp.]